MVENSTSAKHFVGFVYRITNLSNDMKYIGKKQLSRVIKRNPLKGKKNKRISYGQSDWLKYCGSSNTLKEEVEAGKIEFRREILMFCRTKTELSYYEAKLQFDLDVLYRDDYYNDLIDLMARGTWLPERPEYILEDLVDQSTKTQNTAL